MSILSVDLKELFFNIAKMLNTYEGLVLKYGKDKVKKAIARLIEELKREIGDEWNLVEQVLNAVLPQVRHVLLYDIERDVVLLAVVETLLRKDVEDRLRRILEEMKSTS